VSTEDKVGLAFMVLNDIFKRGCLAFMGEERATKYTIIAASIADRGA
jgi:hypothetical protein